MNPVSLSDPHLLHIEADFLDVVHELLSPDFVAAPRSCLVLAAL